MTIFQRPHYTSDVTDFIETLKRADPQLEERQRQGRALLWDKPFDAEQRDAAAQAHVSQKPYVYQTGPVL
jgi:Protein of unknown function (DUF3460)